MAFHPKKSSPNIELPTEKSVNDYLPEIEVKVLPSGFKAYQEGASVKYKPYTYGEIVKFNQSKISRIERFNIVLNGIMTNFDKLELTYADYRYIALLRRISTFGSTKFVSEFSCPTCGGNNKLHLSSENIEFEDIQAPDLPAIITVNGKEVHFSPITLRGYTELENDEDGHLEDRAMARQVTNMSYEEALPLIQQATGKDLINIQQVDEYLYHGVKPEIVTCATPACNQKIRVQVDKEDDVYVYPFREDQDSEGNAIRFGVSEHNKRE